MLKIDVIIPVYNQEKFIEETIRSVMAQTYPAIEIIVVDDGSTDQTAKVVSDLIAKVLDRSIRLVSKKNGGVGSARNFGLKNSSNPYVAFLDGDDLWDSKKLEKQLQVFEQSKDGKLGVVYCDNKYINESGNPFGSGRDYRLDPTLRGNILHRLIIGNQVASSASGVLVKRGCFEKLGDFDEKLTSSEDWDMWLRIANEYHYDFVNEALVSIRRHSSNMSGNAQRLFLNDLTVLQKFEVSSDKNDLKTNSLISYLSRTAISNLKLFFNREGRTRFSPLHLLLKKSPMNYFNLGFSLFWRLGLKILKRPSFSFSFLALILFLLMAPREIFPWTPNDANTAYYVSYARNLLRYPSHIHHFMNLDGVGETYQPLLSAQTSSSYYVDHPMGLIWLAAVSMKVFGSTLIAGRLVSILASVGILFLIVQWAFLAFGGTSAVIAGISVFLMPIFWGHGMVLNFEPLTCFWILLSLFYFSKYFENQKPRDFKFAVIFWVLGMVTDWPAYFVGLPVAYVMIKRKEFLRLTGLFLLSIVTLVCTLGYFQIQSGDMGVFKQLFGHSYHLLAGDNVIIVSDPWLIAMKKVVGHAIRNFGFSIFYLFPIFTALVFLKDIRSKVPFRFQFLLASMAVIGTLNIVLFKQWAADRPFWSYYFLPFFALAMAVLIGIKKDHKYEHRMAMSAFAVLLLLNGPGFFKKTYQQLDTWKQSPSLSALPVIADLLKPGNRMITFDKVTYFGVGYIARWYLDRPLLDGMEIVNGQKTCHSKSDFIVMRKEEWAKVPVELNQASVEIPQFRWQVLLLDKAMATLNVADCQKALEQIRLAVKP